MKYSRLIIIIVFLLLVFPIQTIASNYVSVLCYHSFLGRDKVIYDFSLSELKSQILELRNKGYKFVSYKDVIRGNIHGDRNILVTIDDGNRSVYQAYYQVFKPFGIKPLLAIYPFIIGRKDYSLTWEQLAKLSSDGCDIASHGFFHLKINNKLYNSDKKSFHREIFHSKKTLEEKLNVQIDTFIYPFGLCTDIAIREIKKAGYKYAYTIKPDYLNLPLGNNKDMLRLPRFMLTRGNHKYTIKNIVRKFGEGQQTIIAKGKSEPIISLKSENNLTIQTKKKTKIIAVRNADDSTSIKKTAETKIVSKSISTKTSFNNDIRGSVNFDRIFDYSILDNENKKSPYHENKKKENVDKGTSVHEVVSVSNSVAIDNGLGNNALLTSKSNIAFGFHIKNLFIQQGVAININKYEMDISKSKISGSSSQGNVFQSRWDHLTRNVTSLYTRIIKLKHDRILHLLNHSLPQTASQ
ncbi:MAG TPA: polysaccharide deacetylase family protein [Spirochaetota bacterium]|nr:polysaccharide deacetylase family protein [Spirochaetota bacterium]